MTDTLSFLKTLDSPFLVFDTLSSYSTADSFTPFALTDALIKEAGENKQPFLHFWTTPPQIIMGMMDTKIPYLKDALSTFSATDYPYIVRNSGGLGIVSDEGVLNFSLFFPEGDKRLSINEGYERMHAIMQAAFSDYDKKIEAYEIPDSYCPGDFDLSIDGKKIAGIAQRRLKGGVAVMIYLSVNGDQKKRARIMRQFYDSGLKQKETKWDFPEVNTDSMTTLEEALNESFTLEDIKQRIESVFSNSTISLKEANITPSIHEAYVEGLEKMQKRNDKMLPQLPDRTDD